MYRLEPSFRRAILRDRNGTALIEFALIAPLFFLILMFIFDSAYLMYARSILRGEVNMAGRSSTLETATADSRAAMDARVADRVRLVVPHGQFSFDRTAFGNYSQAQARVEPFIDNDDSNTCNNGESFLDLNGNGQHDLNGGRAGGGGARDVVIYTVSLQYDRLFPIANMIGLNRTVNLRAQTLLKNQPFDSQTQPTTGQCP